MYATPTKNLANQKIIATDLILKMELSIKVKSLEESKYNSNNKSSTQQNPWGYCKQKQSHCCNWGD